MSLKNETMPFGKYRGRKIVDIIDQDYSYIEWLLNKEDDGIDNSLQNLRTKIIKLIQN